MKKNTLQNIYIMCLALSLSFHIFNAEGSGLKLFHIPTLFSCLLTFKLVPLKGILSRSVSWFVALIIISAVVSLVANSLYTSITYVIIIFGCYGMAYVNLDKLLKWMLFLIPIDLLVLLKFAVTQPEFRFKAYYSDPNYMCTTLLCFTVLCIVIFLRDQRRVVKTIMVVSLVVIAGLILLTVSRTGIFCTVLMILLVSFSAIKKHFWKFAFFALISVYGVYYFASDFIDAQWAVLYDRTFDSQDSMNNARETRSNLSMQNINFILDNPQYMIFGLGPGGVHPDNTSQIPGLNRYRTEDLGDHNTWTSVFSEFGLLAFLCFCSIFVITAFTVLKSTNDSSKLLRISYLLSLFLFSLSISQKTYLPFWWGFFLLNNPMLPIQKNQKK